MATEHATDRLRALVETGIAINSELSLEGVLERIVEAAARVTGAQYAALGVINTTGGGLERFVTYGMTPEVQSEIGDPPHGRGILGVLIRDARPLRLHKLSEDPRSVGFPPGHPQMSTFLGVPILLRGVSYGNLYLTEKEGGGDFTDEDEDLVTLLAAQAAVAVENARLYEYATSWSQQLESLNEVGAALAGELELDPLLDVIASRLRGLIAARLVAIALPLGDGLRIAAADGIGAGDLAAVENLERDSKTGRVLERKRSERVDSLLEDPEVNQDVGRRLGATTGLYVPLVVRDRAIGVLVAHDKIGADPRFTSSDLRLAEQFALRAAIAVDLSRRVARDALRRVVAGQELERRRLARELHDETGQALTSILLGLRSVDEAGSSDDIRSAVADLRELVVATLQDVRRLAVQLRPKALDDFGLVPALERLVQTFSETSGIEVDVEARLGEKRLPSEVETTLYRIVQEALTNVVKHAEATEVSILLIRRDASVNAVIEDNGRGFDLDEPAPDSLGLEGMRERVELHDGRLTVETSPGAGTTLAVEVPL
ncbi:MAG TPA: GAF domain-containing protein [Gaiellaceae bacterium]|nr:GAF domain-containing protein [Gaiellaceae bacterium]